MGMLMSQDEFAEALRSAGARAGEPNEANKRLVQRWEAGVTAVPRRAYIRALEAVTGMPIDVLGFVAQMRVSEDGRGGHDVGPSPAEASTPDEEPAAQVSTRGSYSGVWLSRYEYYSSGRENSFVGLHYIVVLQNGNRLTVRSLPSGSSNPNSPLTMDLTVDGNVITGTWVEQTAMDGYYRGARYHGAIQMLAEPTGRRLVGKWVGFGKDLDVNTGPWELVFQDASTSQATMTRYNRRPPS